MNALRVSIIPGSVRSGSLNARLAAVVAQTVRDAGHQPVVLDLRALALPVYDGDLEAAQGIPDGAARLRDALLDSDALLIVTPEYNGFPTPLVINAFDWLSRLTGSDGRGSGVAATTNRPAGLLSASPGALGGLRSMTALRGFLQMNFAMIVVPQQFALSRAHEAFDDAGALKDPKAAQAVRGVVDAVARLALALGRPA